jgi:hypothetical protein
MQVELPSHLCININRHVTLRSHLTRYEIFQTFKDFGLAMLSI